MLTHLNNLRALEQTKELVAGRVYAAAAMVGVLSGCSENCDDTATFVASLLKSCKRLYATTTKLIQLQMKCDPTTLDSDLNRQLLEEMSETLTPRTGSLLLTLQEHTQTGEGKYMSDKKIASQGKIAADVVFEKERMDSFLTKACTRLKKLDLGETVEWLESQIVTSTNRDFKIRTDQIRKAQDRESNKTKKKGDKKRKSKDGELKKTSKKVKSESAAADDEEDGGEEEEDMEEDSEMFVGDNSLAGSLEDEMTDDSDGNDDDDDDDDEDE